MNHGRRDNYSGTSAILSSSLIIRRRLQAKRRGPTPEEVKMRKDHARHEKEEHEAELGRAVANMRKEEAAKKKALAEEEAIGKKAALAERVKLASGEGPLETPAKVVAFVKPKVRKATNGQA